VVFLNELSLLQEGVSLTYFRDLGYRGRRDFRGSLLGDLLGRFSLPLGSSGGLWDRSGPWWDDLFSMLGRCLLLGWLACVRRLRLL
jgi:hypothetical protein